MEVNLDKTKKIHFIGIGGIGLSAIARMMKEKGKKVSGSDLSPSLMTDKLKKLGIKICIGQAEKNISEDMDLIIHTTAVPKNNPELKKAKELKTGLSIPHFNRFNFLAWLSAFIVKYSGGRYDLRVIYSRHKTAKTSFKS